MIRPSSSMSQRPPSGASRPPSSLSRPSSVVSHRTASRISHRSTQRPSTRLSSRIATLCQALVIQVTGLTPDTDDDFDVVLDHVIKRIDSVAKQAAGLDMQTVQTRLRRFARKSRIQSHNILAEAFDICTDRLRAETEKRSDLDTELHVSKLPEHLQMLLFLSLPPSSSTLEYADEIVARAHNPLPAPTGLKWSDILKEEPFEGQHWQGAYGLLPNSLAEQWVHEGSTDSSPPLSIVSDFDLDSRDEMFSVFNSSDSTEISEQVVAPPPPRVRTGHFRMQEERVAATLKLREDLETLQDQQYWRSTWRTDARIGRDFNIGEPSTLGPNFQRVTSAIGSSYFSIPENEIYVNEHDVVREILIALQGRANVIFDVQNNDDGVPSVSVSQNAPKLLHLTPSAQHSILSGFAHLATSLLRLRKFLASVVSETTESTAAQKHPSRTVEAFAEAVELQVVRFEVWVAQREELMLRAHLRDGKSTVVSLLNLEKDMRDKFFDTFDELLGILCYSFPGSTWLSREQIRAHVQLSPSALSARLLDALFDAIQSRHYFGDAVTTSALMRVFLQTAEPVWRMLGRWLCDGIFMPEASNSASGRIALPLEFFIESNDLNVTDPDFWVDGYDLRPRSLAESTSTRHSGVPVFLRSLAEHLLSAGKSIGLLRILGHGRSLDHVHGRLSGAVWPTFGEFMLGLLNAATWPENSDSQESRFTDRVLSAENLSLLLSDHLLPICTNAGKALQTVLYADCEFLRHLHAIENLFLLRKGDVMSDFCDVLFNAMDARGVWTDFHFLNTVFRDAADSLKTRWIDSTLVRLSYKADRKSTLHRSVRNLDALTVEYAAPFPLIFVFNNRASRVYNVVLILLLQVRRAKAALDNILVRGSAANSKQSQDELKIFYATRNKLSWFVNTFLDFICSYILHVEVERFHELLRTASSLDDVMKLHEKHLTNLEELCLLHEKTSSVHRALLSILDMSILFSDCFIAFAGDATLNTSRVSTSRSRRHKSRRLRRESRNVVSFEYVPMFHDEESESSESELDESAISTGLAQDAFSFALPSVSDSFGDDFFSQNEKMTKNLDALVRYIRREIERLALTTEGSKSFGVLAFSLQDWDI